MHGSDVKYKQFVGKTCSLAAFWPQTCDLFLQRSFYGLIFSEGKEQIVSSQL